MLVEIAGKKGEERLVTTSRQVAEDFERRHNDVVDSIRKILDTKNIVAKYFSEYEFEYRGQNFKGYLMDRNGFSLLVMGFTGEKALDWKIKYIDAFNEMENTLKRIFEERKQWEIERAKGIVVRHILTDAIKNMLPESTHKRFAYPTYTNLIYKVLFDKNAKQLQQEYKLQKGESVRDYFTADELASVENLERLSAGLINLGWGYEQIENFLVENVRKKILVEGENECMHLMS